jgi:EmrB/QacA subfamily drug resistance transporter
VLAVAIAGSAMVFVDGTAVNVALPTLQRDLNADAASLQWVVEGYSLVLSAFILTGGAMGDHFGRRRAFLAGVGLFAAASLLCALSQNMLELNLARALQGLGGAFATPGSLALISASFQPAERGKAIGTWSGFASLTAALGPVLGGWLTQTYSWRLVFLINVPLALFVIIAALLRVPESRDPHAPRQIDFAGAVLATVGLGLLTYGLIGLQGLHVELAAVAFCLGGAGVLALFVFYESRVSEPMMPLDVFSNRTFAGANLYTLFLYAAIGGSLFFVPFDLQYVQGYSPMAAGAALLPFIAIMFVSSRWSGGLVARIGARLPLIAGAWLAAAGLVVYAFSGVGHSYWVTFFPATVIFGCGAALFVAPLTTTVMDALDTERAGIASGINNTVSRVAGVLAIAVLGIALIGQFYWSFDRRVSAHRVSGATQAALRANRDTLTAIVVPPGVSPNDAPAVKEDLRGAYAAGFRDAMFLGALLCVVASGIAMLTIPAKPSAAAKAS